MYRIFLVFVLVFIITTSCSVKTQNDQVLADNWQLGPFNKVDDYNPCLIPDKTLTFQCPVRKQEVKWEEKDVFNPAVVVKDEKIQLLYRAEDVIGKFNGTSRLGLATSENGLEFNKLPKPVFFPDNDFMKDLEWEGGVEDPRIVESDDGKYILTYTAYNGDLARLCVASSTDLKNWEKHGLAFGKAENGNYKELWCKAGAIVCRQEGEKLIAAKINGKYWMYWGESNVYAATSDNLIDWYPVVNQDWRYKDFAEKNSEKKDFIVAGKKYLVPVFSTRKKRFDSELVEPGPPALITDKGILLIYNSKNSPEFGDKNLADGTYAAGQVLMDIENPLSVIARCTESFFKPDKPYEITGQVNNVCFVEGLAFFKDSWYLYYGTADSKIGVAKFTP
ncbi:MAG: glycoside hydrolase family 130 protein [Draconibacterium sp.]|nr:glycoside hydrolase family 130 protein [Draconibacterium sp.]